MTYTISLWVEDAETFTSYFFIICGWALANAACITIGYLFLMAMIIVVAWVMHNDMVDKVLNAPINTYFDVTPSGQMIN